jgi:hypothetical protein
MVQSSDAKTPLWAGSPNLEVTISSLLRNS